MDNKKPITIINSRKGTDMAAMPNLSAANKVPKIILTSQIMEKYLGIRLYLDSSCRVG